MQEIADTASLKIHKMFILYNILDIATQFEN